jgi:Orn/Lys/Arg decarboxylase, C-terminal domain
MGLLLLMRPRPGLRTSTKSTAARPSIAIGPKANCSAVWVTSPLDCRGRDIRGVDSGTSTLHLAETLHGCVAAGLRCRPRQRIRFGIVPTRVTDFQVMFLFSMGITKGKWGTLVTNLLSFKPHFDANDEVAQVLPELAAQYGDRYRNVGLRDLGAEMFEYLKTNRPGDLLNRAYETLPTPDLTPREAYQRIVSHDVEAVPVDKIAHRTAANGVMPYPPGIPMLMSGENFGAEDSPDRLPARPGDVGPPVSGLRARHGRRRDHQWYLPRAVRSLDREGRFVTAASFPVWGFPWGRWSRPSSRPPSCRPAGHSHFDAGRDPGLLDGSYLGSFRGAAELKKRQWRVRSGSRAAYSATPAVCRLYPC